MAFSLHPAYALRIAGVTGIPVPTWAWMWPVRIPRDFLYVALRSVLKKTDIRVTAPAPAVIKTNDGAWAQTAVAGFLQGIHGIELRTHASTVTQDDAVLGTVDMPRVEFDSANNGELWVALTASGEPDDKDTASITAAAGVVPVTDYGHPRHGPLCTRDLFRRVRPEIIDAEVGARVADVALAAWPAAPRYFTVRFSAPGRPQALFTAGVLARQSIKVTQSGGGVLWERRIPMHGIVTVAQAPPVAGAPVPPPPVVDITATAGTLRVTDVDVGITLLGSPGSVQVDFATAPAEARVALQPQRPATGDAAARAAYASELATLLLPLVGTRGNRAPHALTEQITTQARERYESPVRPDPATHVFIGTEKPWTGVTSEDLVGFFEGLQRVAFSGASSPPLRPAEAMVLWIMEGKVEARENGVVVDLARRTWRSVETDCAPFHAFSAAAVNGGTDAQIRTLLRVFLTWRYWGLDITNDHSVVAPDNRPRLSGASLAAAVAAADNYMRDRALTAIASAGISAPTVPEVNATLEVDKSTGSWRWRIGPDHIEIMVWLQHAEYLRRATKLPADVAESPTYRYIAYNGGFEKDPNQAGDWNAATNTWNVDTDKIFWRLYDAAAAQVISGAAADMEAGLRWTATATELAVLAGSARGVARFNALLFASLVESYGSLFARAV
jgi:hypothetical protein